MHASISLKWVDSILHSIEEKRKKEGKVEFFVRPYLVRNSAWDFDDSKIYVSDKVLLTLLQKDLP